MSTVLLLLAANVFMTFAWYGHLKYQNVPLWQAILVSWLIAGVEYCLQVPANRLGYGRFGAFELKIMQEALTLVVFLGFAVLWLRETPRWNHLAAFALLLLAVAVAFLPAKAPGAADGGDAGKAAESAAEATPPR